MAIDRTVRAISRSATRELGWHTRALAPPERGGHRRPPARVLDAKNGGRRRLRSAVARPMSIRRKVIPRWLVSAEHQSLERKHQGLQPENERVHQAERIHDVKSEALHGTRLFRCDQVMVAGIGVGDASAAGGDPLEPAFEERLEMDQERAGPRDLLRIDQLLPAAKLAGGNEDRKSTRLN